MFHESQLILYAIAYLIGSIPFGLILTRMAGMGDIRKVGSGNIGATNVLRAGGKKVALATLLLDAGKGYFTIQLLYLFPQYFFPWLASPMCGYDPVFYHYFLGQYLTGLFVIIGHCFPIWLKFKGGKGVATAFGVIFALSWQLGLACAATWLLVFAIGRYSALSALVTMVLMPVYAYHITENHWGGYGTTTLDGLYILATISLLIIIRHHSNIRNLLNGTEHKFGRRKDGK